ncbi:hypothetical protein BST97_00100 [Nonlabens spongiae]|uniref:Glycosyltransferase 2-like domain-containing protein n=2 Tax=Nonlabens spongiae TaxID=331648 RepID=A0A1W6MG37_9FLAO|nr:hypothetical protein BST97_00100 [Nonlabens spongiae]
MSPLVSIIIPTYNRAHIIGPTLDSVIAQTYQNWECIVVDDGSNDNTQEVLNDYVNKDSRFRFYIRPDDHLPGGNGARNYGFKMSKGELIQWFDSDDFMLDRKIELKVEAILSKEYDFALCKSGELTSFNPYTVNQKWKIQSEGNILLDHLKTNIAFTTAGPLFSKKFLNDKNLFDEKVKIGQEWEFYSRLLTYKPRIIYVDKVLYHFRNLQGGIRESIDNEKYLNRCRTDQKLFKFINQSGYFKRRSKLHYDYQQFKFYWCLRRFHYLRRNTDHALAVSNLIKYLKLIDNHYFTLNISRNLFNFKHWNNILKKAL